MKNFNIFGVHRKLRFIGGGGVHEKPICRGRIAYKRGGGLDSLHISGGGLARKRGVVFQGGLILQYASGAYRAPGCYLSVNIIFSPLLTSITKSLTAEH